MNYYAYSRGYFIYYSRHLRFPFHADVEENFSVVGLTVVWLDLGTMMQTLERWGGGQTFLSRCYHVYKLKLFLSAFSISPGYKTCGTIIRRRETQVKLRTAQLCED